MSMSDACKVVDIVRDAGGRVVGRTRLQKIAYLLTVAGLETGLSFTYKHYGPFSENVATGARHAHLLGRLGETEAQASWGGTYSIYDVTAPIPPETPAARRQLAGLAASADAIELELAATAVFLADDGFDRPWEETVRRKPEKAGDGRIERAKDLLERLREIDTPIRLPELG
ncbi:hypothetical protein [Labrys wisconsinensis]|uniref:Uncharacterized protein YwgA n=1 Tax=Labrys wisconsinensis TaxID=425677 RepID=A0ABU0J6C6_9HYPH|nr:hypothetical protein [Labrys wisconsinensis]MDQ0469803.1 uncharacterized protein YwgA [Labrys wisconsinensis]